MFPSYACPWSACIFGYWVSALLWIIHQRQLKKNLFPRVALPSRSYQGRLQSCTSSFPFPSLPILLYFKFFLPLCFHCCHHIITSHLATHSNLPCSLDLPKNMVFIMILPCKDIINFLLVTDSHPSFRPWCSNSVSVYLILSFQFHHWLLGSAILQPYLQARPYIPLSSWPPYPEDTGASTWTHPPFLQLSHILYA